MSKSTELTLPQRAAVALGSAEHEAKLKELAAKHADIVEIKNPAGREQAHGAMMVLANARIAITKSGKAAREDATAFSKAVIEEEKRLIGIIEPEESRLRCMRDDWDAEREREKQAKAEAERQRIEAIRARVEAILLDGVAVATKSPAEIAAVADRIEAMEISLDDFAEFTGQAQAKRDETVQFLRGKYLEAVEREAEAARLKAEREELARLRAAEEERQRVAAAERAEEERKARAEYEAEQARLAEERAAQEAALRAEREAHERQLAAERADAARIAREKLAAEEAELRKEREEQERQMREFAAEQERKLTAERERQAAEAKRIADERAELERQQREAEEQRRREEQTRREAEAREIAKRLAEAEAVERAAPLLLDACRAALAECPDLKCAAQLRTAIDAATDIELAEAA